MELQQQQQQHLISMEGIENTNFRALLTKLINVVLAVLAVLLVLVSTVAGMLGPFLNSRYRCIQTKAQTVDVPLSRWKGESHKNDACN